MTLDCEVVSDVELDDAVVLLLPQLLRFAQQNNFSIPRGSWSITVRFTDDATISAAHQAYFGDLSPTDVISFPSGDDLHATEGYLGDVMISVDTASRNAALEGHSAERELAFLALHGLLHVSGYTDRTDEERGRMLSLQASLLRSFETELGVSL